MEGAAGPQSLDEAAAGERAEATRPEKGCCSSREKVSPERCQACLNVPEIRKTEPSHSGVSWERRCPVHHCPIDSSPNFVRYHPPFPSHMHAPISTRSNGQVPSGSKDSFQPHLYYHCNQQESRSSYALPPLPGHGERAPSCSQRSSGDSSPTPQHESSESRWKQWSRDQLQLRPVQHHIVTVRHDKVLRMPKSFYQVIAEWPVAVLVICSLTILVCTLVGLLVGNLPDFSEPLMGFEPQDTDIGRKLTVWKNMESHTGYRKTLSLFPYTDNSYVDMGMSRGQQSTNSERGARIRRMVEPDYEKDGFFCGPPGKSYSQLVFMSTTAGSLWNLQAIQSMCQMEQDKIRSHAQFGSLCQRTEANECCPSWSLGNYIAALYNRSSCLEITQADVSHTLALLRSCAPDYHKGVLVPPCIGPKTEREKHAQCSKVPEKCTRFRAVYQLLHFLVDRDFLSPQTVGYQVPTLKYSLLFLPTMKGASMMGIYLNNLESWDLFDNYTSITGMDLGLKQKLFQHYLLLDTMYPVMAILTIFLSMFFYLRSIFITFIILMMVFGTLMISYFLYKVAFRFSYFPFINLTAVVILSSLCANHTFVFFDLWNLNKSQNPSAGLLQWVRLTMHHFGYLMLASCLTTGAAFYTGYMSNLIAIRCFAIYMGTSVLVNLVFMLTWLPSSAVLYERYIARKCIYKPEHYWNNSGHKSVILSFHHIFRSLQSTWCQTSKLLFEKILPCGVIKFRYIWICWFAALAIGGAYISCLNPRLKLPTLEMSSVQVFRLSHPFERYDSEYCNEFMFQRVEQGEDLHMPVTLVWGILPVDNGDHFNPRSNGTLVMDAAFTAENPEAQRWLLGFCQKVKNQTFYYSDLEQKSTVCFMEAFHRWMDSRQCSKRDHSFNLCCNHFSFPYGSEVFLHCIKMMIMEQNRERAETRDLGLRFDEKGNLVALVLQFQTVYHYSLNYSKAKHFYDEISLWIREEMSAAPMGLQNGWFTSKLELYNLQHSVDTETMVVLGLAISISFVVLLLTTWNVFLSMFSIMAITGTVLVTVGLLVLLEWQLNAVESLFVSAAVGLSIDFTVNYCISYHLCPHSDRLSRVAFSLKQMSCATVIGASALFSAGVIMLPATVLAYRKLGIFMMMIKCVSCGFASFFFQSLCCFFGPEKNCGQILWPFAHALKDYSDDPSSNITFACGGNEKQNRLQKGQESNNANEQYELQPLARKLSDSFDNSTSTSKLSNRPSVLSDDIQLQDSRCPRMEIHSSFEKDRQKPEQTGGHHVVLCQCPALQTSSPYKPGSNSGTEAESHSGGLCKDCRCQKYGTKAWEHLQSASTIDDGLLNKSHCSSNTDQQKSDYTSENSNVPEADMYELHRCLYSTGSSFSVQNVSSETSLSDFETSIKLVESAGSCPDHLDAANSCCPTRRGHLNGKRDTLRLDLRETVFDTSTSQQNSCLRKMRVGLGGEEPVVLPNSKPDMPDVWIKRAGVQNSGY
ncbi:protein dispatched homolog 2 [Hemicordylus capensis]|uniref:protein dispatched homolog 2 n=1 Tax=Hemicordylus capensis TaxID=884348 RepID=UPI0023031F12|nr:protein dispatched homolog 2 [Hemicordylus capensis]